MNPIKKILVPTDFSDTANLAVKHGMTMAKLFGAKVFLLHVVEVIAGGAESPNMELEEVMNDAETMLRKISKDFTSTQNVEISILHTTGKPTHEIIKAIKENNVDIVVMGTHGASGFDEFFLGSNAHKIITLSPCPVLTIHATAQKTGFSNIVMPIDNSLYSRQKVSYVIELASKYHSTINILGLMEADDTDEKRFEIKLDQVEHTVKKANIPYIRKLTRGNNLAIAAMEYSEANGGDLIVTMTDHESNMTGMFLGTVAKQIVNHSRIPVLSLRPVETTTEEFDPYGGTGVPL